MSPDPVDKQKRYPQPRKGLKNALEGIVERLRDGLQGIADGLRSERPQRVPIPVPVYRPRRR
jgi:hypothetical protein